MSTSNKSIVARLYCEIARGNLDIINDLLAADFVEHEVVPGIPPNRAAVRQMFEGMRRDFRILSLNPVGILNDLLNRSASGAGAMPRLFNQFFPAARKVTTTYLLVGVFERSATLLMARARCPQENRSPCSRAGFRRARPRKFGARARSSLAEVAGEIDRLPCCKPRLARCRPDS